MAVNRQGTDCEFPDRSLAGPEPYRVPSAMPDVVAAAAVRTHDGEEDAMPLTELNHYFVRANDLEKTKDFYCDVLGFQVMPRPTFPFPGYWLGVNGKIQVHMGPDGIDQAELYYLGTPKGAATDHAGVVDHIAFLADDPAGFSRRLREKGIDHQPRSLPEFDLYQIFLKDPNGLTIELNFFGLKDVKDWGGEDYSAMPQQAGMRA